MGAIIKEKVPAISIIIPVYNVENYLYRCLDSIYNQQFSETFEVITVEDCSTDNSLEILKKYKLKHPELIIVEHQENKRLAGARTSGMKIAKGEYLMHVDSDDWLLPNAIDKIYSKCVESDADVVVYNYLIENNEGEKVYLNKIKRELITDDKLKVQHHFFGACWNKIVKRHFIKDLIYMSSEAPYSTEDLIYSTEILLKVNNIQLFPENCYSYFKNSKSITNSTSPKKYIYNQIIVLNNLHKIIEKYKPKNKFENRLMNYFEKWIYFAIFRIHFFKTSNITESKNVLDKLLLSPLLNKNRVKRINISFKYKLISFLEVLRRMGMRFSLAVLLKSK